MREITIFSLFALLILGCSLGIYIHSNCETVKNDELYDNLRETLNYGITVGISSLLTTVVLRFGYTGVFGVFFALASVVASGIYIGIDNKCKKEYQGGNINTHYFLGRIILTLTVIAGILLSWNAN